MLIRCLFVFLLFGPFCLGLAQSGEEIIDLGYEQFIFPIITEPCGEYLEYQYQSEEALAIIDSMVLAKGFSVVKGKLFEKGEINFPIHTYIPELELGIFWIDEDTVADDAICYWIYWDGPNCEPVHPTIEYNSDFIGSVINRHSEGDILENWQELVEKTIDASEAEQRENYDSFLLEMTIHGVYPYGNIDVERFAYLREIKDDVKLKAELKRVLEYQKILQNYFYMLGKSDSLEVLMDEIKETDHNELDPMLVTKLLEAYDKETLSLTELRSFQNNPPNLGNPRIVFLQATNPDFEYIDGYTNSKVLKLRERGEYLKSQKLRVAIRTENRENRDRFFVEYIEDCLNGKIK